MKFAVFLDVDGVLNTRTTCQRSPEGYRGIDSERVKILANAIKQYEDVDLVLTSDWKEMKPESEDFKYLVSCLETYGLHLSGKTVDKWKNRGEGICKYLDEHPQIEDYVILDDNKFDFSDEKKLWERLLITDGIERAEFASRTPEVETMIFMDYIKRFS